MHIRKSLLLLCIVAATAAYVSAQAIQSVYTSMKSNDCKMLEANENEGGWSLQRCSGVGGYQLHVIEGDLRQNIEVVRPDGSKHDLSLASFVGGGGFSSVGEKAEWRIWSQKGKTIPNALIVRFNVSENPEDASKITSYLTVAKITSQEICLIGKVNSGPKANEEARLLADGAATKPCLKHDE